MSNPKRDVLASLVVFLVALPLSLGIAFASGAPIVAGLIAAAIGGIVAGTIGGAPLQVSGPAAGLTVIVFGAVQNLGWQGMCVATAIAGLIQLALGFFRVGRVSLAIPPAVVHGMLAGIGVTIAFAQLQVTLGSSPQSGVLKNLAAMPGNIAKINPAAFALGALCFAIVFFWAKLPKKVQIVPGALVAVLVPTLISVWLNLDVKRIELPANILGEIKFPTMPASNMIVPILTTALTLALVASVESLLCAVATDKLHKGPRANLDRELLGQGAANTISGFLGGLPVTGVIVRSSANIAAGATSRVSAVLHGVWIVLFSLLLGSLLESIPFAVLAGLLVHVGVKLVNAHHIRELASHKELPVYLVTLLGVSCIDLIAGVGLGLGLSIFMVLRRMATADFKVTSREGVHQVLLTGSLTFMNVPKLVNALSAIPPRERVDLVIHTDFMDHSAFEALNTWERSYLEAGGELRILESHEEWYRPATLKLPRVTKTPVTPREPVLVGE